MPIYRVCVTATVGLVRDGKVERSGFYKNEYVRAPDEAGAETVALARVREALGRMEGVSLAGAGDVRVEELECGLPWWRAFQREGFIFFPEDRDSE